MLIADTPNFAVTSWGNGWAYKLTNKAAKTDVFFQDDSAIEFRTLWESYELAYPDFCTNTILRFIYREYQDLAAPIGWAHADA